MEDCDQLTDVNLVDLAIGSVDGVLANVRDATVGNVAVGQRKGLKIAFSRSDSSTAQRPFRDEDVAQTGIMV
jgi:hypothetical protein